MGNPQKRNRRGAYALTLIVALGLAGCTTPVQAPAGSRPENEEMSFDQLGQTDFNRTVTIAMRDNLESLSRLLEKLYRRNPEQWRKLAVPDLATAVQQGRKSIEMGLTPADLNGLHDVEILSVAMDPAYEGDRVGALIFGLADMIVRAHNSKTRFYASDMLNAQHVYNAARNVEVAAWLLASRRDALGRPLLKANEISGDIANLSFEREFGQLIGRLDLIANLLDENLRRVGINYLQGLLFFNFLPVR